MFAVAVVLKPWNIIGVAHRVKIGQVSQQRTDKKTEFRRKTEFYEHI